MVYSTWVSVDQKTWAESIVSVFWVVIKKISIAFWLIFLFFFFLFSGEYREFTGQNAGTYGQLKHMLMNMDKIEEVRPGMYRSTSQKWGWMEQISNKIKEAKMKTKNKTHFSISLSASFFQLFPFFRYGFYFFFSFSGGSTVVITAFLRFVYKKVSLLRSLCFCFNFCIFTLDSRLLLSFYILEVCVQKDKFTSFALLCSDFIFYIFTLDSHSNRQQNKNILKFK